MPEATVTANGREICIHVPMSVHDFVVAQGLPPRGVVVELNGEALPPSEFAQRQLAAGDRMELVKVVAGG